MKASVIVLTVGSAGLLAVGGMAVASASGPTPSPSVQAGASASAGDQGQSKQQSRQDRQDRQGRQGRGGDRLLRHTLHGELTVGGRAGADTHVVVVQRGEITAVDSAAHKVTVKSPDGFTRTYVVNGDTTIRSKGADESFGDLKAGDRVMVKAEQSGGTLTAKAIRCVQPGEKPAASG